jgi:hypothetical protein
VFINWPVNKLEIIVIKDSGRKIKIRILNILNIFSILLFVFEDKKYINENKNVKKNPIK